MVYGLEFSRNPQKVNQSDMMKPQMKHYAMDGLMDKEKAMMRSLSSKSLLLEGRIANGQKEIKKQPID